MQFELNELPAGKKGHHTNIKIDRWPRKLSVVLLTSLFRVASYFRVAVLQMALLNWESFGDRLVLQRFETVIAWTRLCPL